MWGFWAGSLWRGEDAAIVDLDWSLNAAGRRYETLMRRWTTTTVGTTSPAGALSPYPWLPTSASLPRSSNTPRWSALQRGS